MSSLCSLVSVIISIHQPLFRAYVCPLWSTLIFVDYSCESAESSLSFCRIQCTTPRRTLSLSPCRRSSKASVRRERTPPNPSGREQPTYARPAGLFPSGPGPATPVVDNPITQSPSPCCRYSLAVPAAIWRATSGWTAPSLRSSSASTPRIEPWHECHTSPRNREKPSTLPARARKRRPTASRQRFGGCDLEMVGFAICKNGRSQFIALRLVGGSRLVP